MTQESITELGTVLPTSDHDLLFGMAELNQDNDDDGKLIEVSTEQQLKDTVRHYETLIESLKDDFECRLSEVQNPPKTKVQSKQESNDSKYLLKIMEMVIKRIENKQYDKALNDLYMTIEEFKLK